MLEKILTKLKAQRGKTSNVSDKSLEALAKGLEKLITTDEILESMDFTEQLASLDGNINHYTAMQVQNVKMEQQKAIDEAVKEALKKGKKPEDTQQRQQQQTAIPEEVANQLKELSDTVNALKTEKLQTQRVQQLKEKLKDTPGFYVDTVLDTFMSLNFETEEQFTAYVEKVTAKGQEVAQQAKEKGLNFSTPGQATPPPAKDGQTEALRVARELVKNSKKE